MSKNILWAIVALHFLIAPLARAAEPTDPIARPVAEMKTYGDLLDALSAQRTYENPTRVAQIIARLKGGEGGWTNRNVVWGIHYRLVNLARDGAAIPRFLIDLAHTPEGTPFFSRLLLSTMRTEDKIAVNSHSLSSDPRASLNYKWIRMLGEAIGSEPLTNAYTTVVKSANAEHDPAIFAAMADHLRSEGKTKLLGTLSRMLGERHGNFPKMVMFMSEKKGEKYVDVQDIAGKEYFSAARRHELLLAIGGKEAGEGFLASMITDGFGPSADELLRSSVGYIFDRAVLREHVATMESRIDADRVRDTKGVPANLLFLREVLFVLILNKSGDGLELSELIENYRRGGYRAKRAALDQLHGNLNYKVIDVEKFLTGQLLDESDLGRMGSGLIECLSSLPISEDGWDRIRRVLLEGAPSEAKYAALGVLMDRPTPANKSAVAGYFEARAKGAPALEAEYLRGLVRSVMNRLSPTLKGSSERQVEFAEFLVGTVLLRHPLESVRREVIRYSSDFGGSSWHDIKGILDRGEIRNLKITFASGRVMGAVVGAPKPQRPEESAVDPIIAQLRREQSDRHQKREEVLARLADATASNGETFADAVHVLNGFVAGESMEDAVDTFDQINRLFSNTVDGSKRGELIDLLGDLFLDPAKEVKWTKLVLEQVVPKIRGVVRNPHESPEAIADALWVLCKRMVPMHLETPQSAILLAQGASNVRPADKGLSTHVEQLVAEVAANAGIQAPSDSRGFSDLLREGGDRSREESRRDVRDSRRPHDVRKPHPRG